MGLINLISGNDIENIAVTEKIIDEIKKYNNFIYITATTNIKEIRENQFKGLVISYSDENKAKEANLFTFTQFQKDISHKVFSEDSYISTADQRYILSKIIELDNNLDHRAKKALHSMRYELYELYKFLLFYEIKAIPEGILNIIESDYSITEKQIFYLYNVYSRALANLIKGIRDGNLKDQNIDKSILDLFKRVEANSKIDLYINSVKTRIDNTLSKVEAIFMDGFLFFDDLQKYVITSAVKLRKRVNLVAKYSVSDETNSFLFEDNYLKLSKELGQEISLPSIGTEEYNDDTALNYVKMKYPSIDTRLSPDVKSKMQDGTIVFVQPFSSRDKELQYIVNKISELIEYECSNDERKIKEFVNKDIAIVLAVEKGKYEDRLSGLFREVGVFIYNDKKQLKDTAFSEVDSNTINRIYFSKRQFLNSIVKYRNGRNLTFDEKYKFFKTMYKGIQINREPRPIASYPIGQFIFQIYNIIAKGMTIEGFKMILYSNWHYNVGKTSQKWNLFISQFRNIQVYFENLYSIDEWIEEVQRILTYKYDIENNSLYNWHPFKHIDTEFIISFLNILKELSIIINSVKDVEGSIEEHINELKNKIMDADRILKIDQQDLSFEQKIITKFNSAISQIGKSSIVDGLDSNYFSDNLKSMLTDWEKEQLEEEVDGIRINVVNLENMHKFKYSFFMMLEADKYPRKYKYEFPFTEDILEIMADDKYGINKLPAEIHGTEYHLKLEQYLFKNVLDFTKHRLYITFTEKEDKNTNKPSIYVEDITSMFDVDIKDVYETDVIKEKSYLKFNKSKIKAVKLPNKSTYSISELGMYMLCPRLYFQVHYNNQKAHINFVNRFQLRFYCEAVLYCSLFEKFKEYSEAYNVVYSSHNDEYYFVLKSLLQDAFAEVIRYFDFLTEYEKKDIKNKVLVKAVNLVTSIIISQKFNEFKVKNCQNHTSDGYKLNFEFENDILFTDFNNTVIRRYQNRKYVDYLVLKTGEKVSSSTIKDIDSIIECLDRDTTNVDRISLTSSLITKLNILFKTNINTAKELVKRIENTDFIESKIKKSGFCTYCLLSDICKGHHHMSKEDRNEL